MRSIPEWLTAAAEMFAVLPVERQQAVLRCIAEELLERTSRLRDRIRPEDLPAFDAAAAGIVDRSRQRADGLRPGTRPCDASVLIELALDNRGVSLLEPIAMQAVRAALRSKGLDSGRS